MLHAGTTENIRNREQDNGNGIQTMILEDRLLDIEQNISSLRGKYIYKCSAQSYRMTYSWSFQIN